MERTDANQSQIVKELRAYIGISVMVISNFGSGIGDIMLGYKKRNWLFEIKNKIHQKRTTRSGSYDKILTPAEKKFIKQWQGQINVVFNTQEILEIINYGKIYR